MDGRDWKWDMDFETDFSEVEPGQYTVDEILSQFRDEYSDNRSESEAEEPSAIPHAHRADETPNDFEFPEEEEVPEDALSEPVPVRPETKETNRPRVGFMQKKRTRRGKTSGARKSWRDLIPGPHGRQESGMQEEDELYGDPEPAEEMPDGNPDPGHAWDRPERDAAETKSAERENPTLWTALIQDVKSETETERSPESDPAEAEETESPEKEQTLIGEGTREEASEDTVQAELPPSPVEQSKPEESKKRRSSASGRKQKVWEEFPDTPEQESEPFTDTLDYSVLFKMFADQPQNRTEAEPDEAVEEKHTPEADNADLTAADAPDGTESGTGQEKEPLLAETSMDFRDILREFMLGDQHPFYADMPGIGKKSEPAVEQETARESESEPVPARKAEKKTDHNIWEDFPLDFAGKAFSRENAAPPEESSAEPEQAEIPFRRERGPTEEKQPAELLRDTAPDSSGEPQQQGQDGSGDELSQPEKKGLRHLLHGLGEKAEGLRNAGFGRKKALNEPRAFVGYEDYLPTEGEQKEKAPEENAQTLESRPENEGDVSFVPPEQAEQETASSEQENPENPEDDEILYAGDFPTFGQWILNELMNIWIRLNGIGDRESTATMEDASEDLGKEVNVANASRYYGSQVTMLRMRFQIGLAILAVLAYLTLGFPVSGMLKTAKVSAAMCLGLQLTIMLLCLDIVTNAAINLIRRKFGADGLAVLFCVITSLDSLVVAVGGFGRPHIPLCLFSSLSLMGILFSSLLSARALRKAIRVPAIGKRVYCVTAEEGVRGGRELTLLKSVRPVAGFVRRAEEAPPDEMLFLRFAVVELALAILLSLLTGLVKHSMGDFLYILSAILSCAVPVTALLAFALPYYIGSQRIFSSGAAIAGWSGMHDIGCSRNLIVTDRDLFPEDTVAIETVRIFADDNAERVIGYAGTMIAASGSGLAPCFAELMEKNGCRMRQVEEFRWLSGGGLQGIIEGHTVLCGNSDLMQLMNVKIPYRLVDRMTVLLSIDGVLYGIFKIQYTGLPEIRSALQELIASNRHPIFAIRDFNITPDLLHEVFDVATDGYDFPPFGDRFRISEAQPSDTSKISAVVCREGLGPLTHLADTGRSMYVAVRLNLIITALAAAAGILLVFFRLIGAGMVSAWLPFVIMLLDALTVSLISLFMRF